MTTYLKFAALAMTAAALSGCVEDTGGSASSGVSGTPDEFSAMASPCIAQASRMTGAQQGSITILDRIQTGGGPILTISAAGAKYTCRREADGSVTVFSEFAN